MPSPISQTLFSELTFGEIIVGVVVALILVSLWQRALENWLFEVLGIDRKSTFQTFIVALAFTVVFFVFINTVESLARDVILGLGGPAAAQTVTASTFGDRRDVSVIVAGENGGCKREGRANRCGTLPRADTLERSGYATKGTR